jgi:2-methylcitrate dehydratase PrpD
VHQSKFSMGTVLGLIAKHRKAGLQEFDEALSDPDIRGFRQRVTMRLDPEVDAAYPRQWLGRVTVTTRDGRTLSGRVDIPKGDPDNTLNRPEIEDKAMRLGGYHGAATPDEIRRLIAKVWSLAEAPRVERFLS